MTLSASVARESVDPRWLQLRSAEKHRKMLTSLKKMQLFMLNKKKGGGGEGGRRRNKNRTQLSQSHIMAIFPKEFCETFKTFIVIIQIDNNNIVITTQLLY